MLSNYHVVTCGREVGIFSDWLKAKASVDGYSGGSWKSFSRREDAEIYLKSSEKIAYVTIPVPNKTIVYISTIGISDFGMIVLSSSGDKYEINGKLLGNSAIYSVYVALSLIKGDLIVYSDSSYCVCYLRGCIQTKDKMGTLLGSLMKGRNIVTDTISCTTNPLYKEARDLSLSTKGNEIALEIHKNGEKQGTG